MSPKSLKYIVDQRTRRSPRRRIRHRCRPRALGSTRRDRGRPRAPSPGQGVGCRSGRGRRIAAVEDALKSRSMSRVSRVRSKVLKLLTRRHRAAGTFGGHSRRPTRRPRERFPPRFPLAEHQSQGTDDGGDDGDPGPDHPLNEAEFKSVQTRIQRFVGHVVGSSADGTRDDFSLIAVDAPSRQLSGYLKRVEHACSVPRLWPDRSTARFPLVRRGGAAGTTTHFAVSAEVVREHGRRLAPALQRSGSNPGASPIA